MASDTPAGLNRLSYREWVGQLLARPPRNGKTWLLCIDGPAGSGKTTFAQHVSLVTHAAVAHMDELYEGWEGAFAPELPARIDAWILTPLRNGLEVRHPRFDWYTNSYTEWVTHPSTDLFIIEGVGSASASIRAHADAVVWVECQPTARLDRVLTRDGEAIREPMVVFQEQEQAHFSKDRTRESADLFVHGDQHPENWQEFFFAAVSPPRGGSTPA